MKIEIQSLDGKLERYLDDLRGKIKDMDSHLVKRSYGDREWLVLEGVEIESLQDFADIFKDMEEQMGYAGQITFDAKEGIVYILDTWIE